MTLDEIKADFDLLDDWEDRYRFLIELGRNLPPMPDGLKTETTRVRGCTSQVWLVSKATHQDADAPVLHFQADSDAHIVRGLIAVMFAMYQDQPADKILDLDAEGAFAALGLKDHLTPQRSNGLASMVARVRSDARVAAGVTPPPN